MSWPCDSHGAQMCAYHFILAAVLDLPLCSDRNARSSARTAREVAADVGRVAAGARTVSVAGIVALEDTSSVHVDGDAVVRICLNRRRSFLVITCSKRVRKVSTAQVFLGPYLKPRIGVAVRRSNVFVCACFVFLKVLTLLGLRLIARLL